MKDIVDFVQEYYWYIVTALVILAAVSSYLGYEKYQEKKGVSKWLKIQAKILKRTHRMLLMSSNNEFLMAFKLLYEYEIKGIKFKGWAYCDPEDYASTDSELKERVQEKFAVGNYITVLVNPENLKKSTITTRLPDHDKIILALGAMCLVLMVVMLMNR